jgi:hypothetical protein
MPLPGRAGLEKVLVAVLHTQTQPNSALRQTQQSLAGWLIAW